MPRIIGINIVDSKSNSRNRNRYGNILNEPDSNSEFLPNRLAGKLLPGMLIPTSYTSLDHLLTSSIQFPRDSIDPILV